MLGAGLGVLFAHFYDPLNKTSNQSGQIPFPTQLTLTNNGSIPLMLAGAVLSFDFLLLDGGIVNADYDLIGQVMLVSLVISGLMVARCLFQNNRSAKIEALEATEVPS